MTKIRNEFSCSAGIVICFRHKLNCQKEIKRYIEMCRSGWITYTRKFTGCIWNAWKYFRSEFPMRKEGKIFLSIYFSSRPLLHAVQPPRKHGQKPSWTMYRIVQWDRVWAILGGQDKNDGILTFLFVTTSRLLLIIRTFVLILNGFNVLMFSMFPLF